MPIKFNIPFVAGTELGYLHEVVDSGFFNGNGSFTKRVQAWLEQRYGVPKVLLTHSCTGALEMAALLLDLGPGDEVIIPSYTFSTTASAFMRTGARPVFCEIDPATMNLDWRDVERRITSRTRAIVPVHYGGISADMKELSEVAAVHGITIVEDAAQGIEAKYGESWLGTLSPLAAISFHETKNIHCGLGGALLLNDASYADRAENIWERGTDRSKLFKGLVDKYSWVELGSSFYPTELQAAFLMAQLEAIDENTTIRRRIYEGYDRRLKPMAASGWFALPHIAANRTINYHSYFLVCNSIAQSDALRKHLVDSEIQAFIGYVPLHSSRMGQQLGYTAEDLPLTEEYSQRVLRLPFHHKLSDGDVSRIADAIAEFFG